MTDPGSDLVGRTGYSTCCPLATDEVLCPSVAAEEAVAFAAVGAGGVANAHWANDEKVVARERT